MRRDRAKAEDYARRHNVPRVYVRPKTSSISRGRCGVHSNAAVDPLGARARRGGCREAVPGRETDGMNTQNACEVDAFARANRPLWVAFYRRALPRF